MVKAGYKQTEIGVIPEDWDVKTLGEVSQIFGRIGFRGYTVNDIVDETKGAITISPSNIFNNKTIFEKCTYISWAKYEESPEIKIFNGDILLVKTGSTVGKSAIVKDLKKEATINPQIVVLKKISINNFYLGYIVNHEDFQKNIVRTTVGGAIPTLSQKQVASYQIPIPPKEEQKAIAKALNDTDALITSLEKLIAKKERIKQGTMQQLLTGKKRLEGFSGAWEEKRLDEISKITMGQSPSSSNYNNQNIGLPLIQGNADIKSRITIVRNFTSEITKKAFIGDIVMSVRAPVGEIAKATFDCCIGRGVCAIKADNDFLYYYLIFIESTWSKSSTGSTFDSVNSDVIKSLKVYLPKEIKEQQAIAQILSDMDSEIEALKAKLAKTKAIKEGMMSELLTGKTRLKGAKDE